MISRWVEIFNGLMICFRTTSLKAGNSYKSEPIGRIFSRLLLPPLRGTPLSPPEPEGLDDPPEPRLFRISSYLFLISSLLLDELPLDELPLGGDPEVRLLLLPGR